MKQISKTLVICLLALSTGTFAARTILPANATFFSGMSASLVIGQSSFTTSLPETTPHGFRGPNQAAFDPSGNLWVTDDSNERVLEFAPPFSNGMDASLVIGQSSFTASTCATTQSGLCAPVGVAFDHSGDLWVTDLPGRVLEFTPPFSNGMSASVVMGQSSFTTNSCVSPPTQNSLCEPDGIVFDPSGNLWISARDDRRVLEFTPPFSNGMSASLVIGHSSFTDDVCVFPPASAGLCNAGPLTVDLSGNLWVTDGQRVLEFTRPFSNGMSASLVIGQPDFTTFSGSSCLSPTQSGVCTVGAVAFDSSGKLWVSDRLGNRVLQFTPPFSNGMDASLVIGAPDFTTLASGCSPITQSGLCLPLGVASDHSGNLWVVDGNNRVLEFSPTGRLGVSKFFTDSSLNSLPTDSSGNPKVDVLLAGGVVRGTNPGQVLAWINVTNTSGSPLQSLKLDETLPVEWAIHPAWMPGIGAIHVFFASTVSLATNPEITQPSTITVSTGNPEVIHLSVPSFSSTSIGHPLMPGQSILVSVKLTYSLTGTSQSPSSYPRNYADAATAAAWTQPSFTGSEFTGTASAFFTANAKIVS